MPDDPYGGETVAIEAELLDSKDRARTPQPSVGLTVQVLNDAEDTTLLAETAMDRAGEDSGTATGATPSTLVDSTRSWVVDSLKGAIVRMTSGGSLNQERRIKSNTATTITIDTQEANEATGIPAGNWPVTPVAGETYQVHRSRYRKYWAIPTDQAGKTLTVLVRSKDATVGTNAEKRKLAVAPKAV